MDIVVTAGLCNDLGQGIMSHLFDRQLIPVLAPFLKWNYKDASTMMLHHLIDNNHVEIDTNDLKKVCQLIEGSNE